MSDWLEHEPQLRLMVFVFIFLLLALWEWLSPRRVLTVSKAWRWLNNLGLILLNSVSLRLCFPMAAVGVAGLAERHGYGVLPMLDMPTWLVWGLGFLILDLAIWAQHVLFHKLPLLWRLHRMHHADLDFDLTTGLRFHPFEILLSMLFKAGLILALGIPAVVVLVFEVVLNASAMFNHSNIKFPEKVDRYLRWFLVTPDMHRVHHSTNRKETDSNYGFCLPWWDRLLGTYLAQPRAGHLLMILGITLFRQQEDLRLDKMLIQPFRDE